MRLDLHIHSSFSPDGAVHPKRILKLAKARKLDGIAITDHNDARAYASIVDYTGKSDLILVRGVEISTSEGHILAYGMDSTIPRGLPPAETVERIRNEGGVSVVAHPYRIVSGVGPKICKGLGADAVETINGRSPEYDNRRAKKLALQMGAPCIGGSDSHDSHSLGKAWTFFKDVSTEDDVLDSIEKGRVKPGGRGNNGSESLDYVMKAASKWARRGFKRV